MMFIVVFFCAISVVLSLIPSAISSRTVKCKSVFSLSSSVILESLDQADLSTNYDTMKELKNFIEADIYPGDNFWTGSRRRFRADRLKTVIDNNMEKRIELEKNYNKAMNMGFEKRVESDAEEFNMKYASEDETSIPFPSMLNHVINRAQVSTQSNDAKELTFDKLKREMVEKRRGLLNFLPKFTHRIIDYLASLRKPPSKQLLLKNLVFGAFFAGLMIYNTGRRAFTFAVAGNLIICSLLLSRGMPVKDNQMGMDRRAVNWSTQSWLSAFGITAMFSASGVFLTKSLLDFFIDSISTQLKWSLGFAVGMMLSAIGTSFYEVFESKDNGGWRWRNVANGYLPLKIETKLREQVFGEDVSSTMDMEEGYEFEYNPDMEDAGVVDTNSKIKTEMAGVNVRNEITHYEKWVEDRKEVRRPPSSSFAPGVADTMVGARSNFFEVMVSEDLRDSYREITTRLNPWRKKKLQFKKNFVDDPIIGPYAFRDKTPDWVDDFSGIFTDKITQRQKMARSYGTYRKSMYKKDGKVVLLPSDGAKEKPPALPSSEDDEGDGNGVDDFMREQDDQ